MGNVNVGVDIPLTSLKPHYDGILFAYGASEDKRLGIPGEDLEGVYSARAFVGWYNGLPEYADLDPALDAGETAVVIGQGNVAMDVARILLSSVDELRKTDITEYALERLSMSRVKNVQVVGRRGPMQVNSLPPTLLQSPNLQRLQAAFTIKELRELLTLRNVSFEPIDPSLLPADTKSLARQPKRLTQLLAKGSTTSASTALRSWALKFLLSPTSFNPSSTSNPTIGSTSFTLNAFRPDVDPLSKTAAVSNTSETLSLPSSLAFRSVGYKSTPIPGLVDLGVMFDEKQGIIPNDPSGRIINPELGPGPLTAAHVPGLYAAGWVKRGPTGVIASTMDDAFASADAVVQDHLGRVRGLNADSDGEGTGLGWEGLSKEVENKGVRRVSWEDWKKIDAVERERGKAKGKGREKIGRVADMLKVLDG